MHRNKYLEIDELRDEWQSTSIPYQLKLTYTLTELRRLLSGHCRATTASKLTLSQLMFTYVTMLRNQMVTARLAPIPTEKQEQAHRAMDTQQEDQKASCHSYHVL